MEFEGLVVLALDLKFRLKFLDKELEAGDFRPEFLDVARGRRRTNWRGKGLLGRVVCGRDGRRRNVR